MTARGIIARFPCNSTVFSRPY